MCLISNYQYSFTLFTPGLESSFKEGYISVAVIFSLFLSLETWINPVSGYIIDKFGINKIVAAGGLIVGLGWVLCYFASSLTHIYIYYGILCGVGCGTVYIGCQGNAIKWFPDKRGLAVGITAAGFGGGAALTIIPVSMCLENLGWRTTFLIFGLIQGLIIFIVGITLRAPSHDWIAPIKDIAKQNKNYLVTKHNYHWFQTLKTKEFWLLYFMFVITATGGLIICGNVSKIIENFNLKNYTIFSVNIIAITATTVSLCNAFARIFWGALSDKLGRANTMALSFTLDAIFLYLITTPIARNPYIFIILMGLAIFCWGQVFSIYSATCGDIFGPRYATANYGMLYSAKGVASWLAGMGAAAIAAIFHSWIPGFYIAAFINLLAGFLAFCVLKRIIKSRISSE
jgi:OFA family oxalate/formate antiporter-like MFS transporter